MHKLFLVSAFCRLSPCNPRKSDTRSPEKLSAGAPSHRSTTSDTASGSFTHDSVLPVIYLVFNLGLKATVSINGVNCNPLRPNLIAHLIKEFNLLHPQVLACEAS